MKIRTTASFYSAEQILEYLQLIGYEPPTSLDGIVSNLDTLTKIVRKHLITFPFENLDMHYTKSGKMDVTPSGVFDQLVSQKKGRGSYCFGQNTLLLGVLKGLGFKVAAGAARVNASSDTQNLVPLSLCHMILFVQLPGEQDGGEDQLYLVDVGFGGVFGMSGLVRPIPIVPDITHSGSAPPEEHRLTISPHPSSSSTGHGDYWMLQARCGRPDWKTLYLFHLTEFFLEDFEDFSYVVAHREPGVMQRMVICIKPSPVGPRESDKDGDPLQRHMVVGNKLIQRIGSSAEELRVFATEEERFGVIKDICGVTVEDKEAAIKSVRVKASRLPQYT